jgi:hypothetical protein
MSKYYGESERLLASVFSAGNEFMEGAIIFLDEVKKHSYFFYLKKKPVLCFSMLRSIQIFILEVRLLALCKVIFLP